MSVAKKIGLISLQVFAVAVIYLMLAWPAANALQISFFSSTGQSQADLKSFGSLINTQITTDYQRNRQYLKVRLNNIAGYNIEKIYLFKCRDYSPSECIEAGRPPSVTTFDIQTSFEDTSLWFDVANNNVANIMVYAKVNTGSSVFWTGQWTTIRYKGPTPRDFDIDSYEVSSIRVELTDDIDPLDAKSYVESQNYVPGSWVEKIVFSTVDGSDVSKVETTSGSSSSIDRQGTMIPSFFYSEVTGNEISGFTNDMTFTLPAAGSKIGNPVPVFLNSGTAPPSQTCPNNIREGTEECDGTDSSACPGQCQSDCTCPGIKPPCTEGLIPSACNCGGNVYSVGYCCSGNYQTSPCGTQQPSCGNNIREAGEDCDGTDDIACPGLCQNCVCTEPLPPVLRFEGITSGSPYQCGLPGLTGMTAKFSVSNEPSASPAISYSLNGGEYKSTSCSGKYTCKVPEDELCTSGQEDYQITFKFSYGTDELTSSFNAHVSFPPPSMAIDSITPNTVEAGEKTNVRIYLHVRNPSMIQYNENTDFEIKYLDRAYEPSSCSLDSEGTQKKYYNCEAELDIPEGYEGYQTVDFKLRYTLNGVKTLTTSYYPLIVRPKPTPICGNIVKETGEECDDTDDEDCPGRCDNCVCGPEPPPDPVCGNDIKETGEECDGTDDDQCGGKTCNNDCTCPPPDPVVTIQIATVNSLDCNTVTSTQTVDITTKIKYPQSSNPTFAYSTDDGSSFSTLTCSKTNSNANTNTDTYKCLIAADDLCSIGEEHFTLTIKTKYGSDEFLSNSQPMFMIIPEPNLQVLYITGEPFRKAATTTSSVRLYISDPNSPLAPASPIFEYSYDGKAPTQMTCTKTSTVNNRAYYSCDSVDFEVRRTYSEDLMPVIFSVKDSVMVHVVNVEIGDPLDLNEPGFEIRESVPVELNGSSGDSVQVTLKGVLLQNDYVLDTDATFTTKTGTKTSGVSCTKTGMEGSNMLVECSLTLRIPTDESSGPQTGTFELMATADDSNIIAVKVEFDYDNIARQEKLINIRLNPADIYCEGAGQNSASQIEFTAEIDEMEGDLSIIGETVTLDGKDVSSDIGRVCSLTGKQVKCSIPVNTLLDTEIIDCSQLETDSITKHPFYVRLDVRGATASVRGAPSGSIELNVHAPALKPEMEILRGPDKQIITCIQDNTITIELLKIDNAELLHETDDIQWSFGLNALDTKGKISTSGEHQGDDNVVCIPNDDSGESSGYIGAHRYEYYTCYIYVKESMFTRCPQDVAWGDITLKARGSKGTAETQFDISVWSDLNAYNLKASATAPSWPSWCQIQQYDGRCYLMGGNPTNFTVTVLEVTEKPLPTGFTFSTTTAILEGGDSDKVTVQINCNQVSPQLPAGSLEHDREYFCNVILPQVVNSDPLTEDQQKSDVEIVKPPYSLGGLNVTMAFTYAQGKGVSKLSVDGLPGKRDIERRKTSQLLSWEKQMEDAKAIKDKFMKVVKWIMKIAGFCIICWGTTEIYQRGKDWAESKKTKAAGLDSLYEPEAISKVILSGMATSYVPETDSISFAGTRTNCDNDQTNCTIDGGVWISEDNMFGPNTEKNCCKLTNDCQTHPTETRNFCQENNIAWKCDMTVMSCCETSLVCVHPNYPCSKKTESVHTGLNPNKDDDIAYCNTVGRWIDCDDDADKCSSKCTKTTAGESGVGEYTNYGSSGTIGCCGDDADEHLVKTPKVSGTGTYDACCKSDQRCVTEDGLCKTEGSTVLFASDGYYYKCSNKKWVKTTEESAETDEEACKALCPDCWFTDTSRYEGGLYTAKCCGVNNNNEKVENEVLVTCKEKSGSDMSWSCSDSAKMCCIGKDDCVKDKKCYDSGKAHLLSEKDDDFAKCENNEWVDCDKDSSTCSACAGANGWIAGCTGSACWVKAGEESGVGEYGATGCCGDDDDEYYVKTEAPVGASSSSTEACCKRDTDCVKDGKCYKKGSDLDAGNKKYECGTKDGKSAWVPDDGDGSKEMCDQFGTGLWVASATYPCDSGDCGKTDPTHYCCGDDSKEYKTETTFQVVGGTLRKACCPNDSDCIAGDGSCKKLGSKVPQGNEQFECIAVYGGKSEWKVVTSADNDKGRCESTVGPDAWLEATKFESGTTAQCCGDQTGEHLRITQNGGTMCCNHPYDCATATECISVGKSNPAKQDTEVCGSKGEWVATAPDASTDDNLISASGCEDCISKGGRYFESKESYTYNLCLKETTGDCKYNDIQGDCFSTAGECANTAEAQARTADEQNAANQAQQLVPGKSPSSGFQKALDAILGFCVPESIAPWKDPGGWVKMIGCIGALIGIVYILTKVYDWLVDAFKAAGGYMVGGDEDTGDDLLKELEKGMRLGLLCVVAAIAGDLLDATNVPVLNEIGKASNFLGEGAGDLCGILLKHYKLVIKIATLITQVMMMQMCFEQMQRNIESAQPGDKIGAMYTGINMLNQVQSCLGHLQQIAQTAEDITNEIEEMGSDLGVGGGAAGIRVTTNKPADELCEYDAEILVTCSNVREKDVNQFYIEMVDIGKETGRVGKKASANLQPAGRTSGSASRYTCSVPLKLKYYLHKDDVYILDNNIGALEGKTVKVFKENAKGTPSEITSYTFSAKCGDFSSSGGSVTRSGDSFTGVLAKSSIEEGESTTITLTPKTGISDDIKVKISVSGPDCGSVFTITPDQGNDLNNVVIHGIRRSVITIKTNTIKDSNDDKSDSCSIQVKEVDGRAQDSSFPITVKKKPASSETLAGEQQTNKFTETSKTLSFSAAGTPQTVDIRKKSGDFTHWKAEKGNTCTWLDLLPDNGPVSDISRMGIKVTSAPTSAVNDCIITVKPMKGGVEVSGGTPLKITVKWEGVSTNTCNYDNCVVQNLCFSGRCCVPNVKYSDALVASKVTGLWEDNPCEVEVTKGSTKYGPFGVCKTGLGVTGAECS